MTNFGQNPVQATKTNKQFPQLKRGMDSDGGDFICTLEQCFFFLWDPTSYNSGRDDVNIRVHSVLAKPAISSTIPGWFCFYTSPGRIVLMKQKLDGTAFSRVFNKKTKNYQINNKHNVPRLPGQLPRLPQLQVDHQGHPWQEDPRLLQEN